MPLPSWSGRPVGCLPVLEGRMCMHHVGLRPAQTKEAAARPCGFGSGHGRGHQADVSTAKIYFCPTTKSIIGKSACALKQDVPGGGAVAANDVTKYGPSPEGVEYTSSSAALLSLLKSL